MAGVTATAPRRARWLADAVLKSYAQLFFSESRLSGAVLLAATWLSPWAALLALGAVLLALAVVGVAHFSLERAGRGLYGFSPLFLGLAVGTWFDPGPGPVLALALGVVAVVLLQVSLEAALGYYFVLPPVSLPFVAVGHLVWLSSAAVAGLTHAAASPAAPATSFGLRFLEALGAVFFQPGWLTGALVLLALVLSSRIAALLALEGFAVAAALLAVVHPSVAVPSALVA